MPTAYTSAPITLGAAQLGETFKRADIEFHEVDHSGPSFEARVFFNNPAADENTSMTTREGYVGSFFVFGHGGCFGDVGHCDIPEAVGPYDLRLPHQLLRTRKQLTATDAVRRVIAGGGALTVRVVPVVRGSAATGTVADDLLKIGRVSIISYA